jgi:hypothetical protein
MFVYSLWNQAPDQIFDRGGSGMIGNYFCQNQNHCISGIKWSPDGDTAIFCYYPNKDENEFEIYMITNRKD